MLRSIQVENFKGIKKASGIFFEGLNHLQGGHGSGKSNMFEALFFIKNVVQHQCILTRYLNTDSICKLRDSNILYFKIAVSIGNVAYIYMLEIIHNRDFYILSESLSVDNDRLFSYINSVYTDSNVEYSETKCKRTFLGRLAGEKHLPFIDFFRDMQIVQIDAHSMNSTISDKYLPDVLGCNYAELFYRNNEESRAGIVLLEERVKQIVPEFSHFVVTSLFREKQLNVAFTGNVVIPFSTLSPNLKALIALYTIVFCSKPNSLICIDSIENFLTDLDLPLLLTTLSLRSQSENVQCILTANRSDTFAYLPCYKTYLEFP